MSGPLKIEGKFLTAGETAGVLGVSKRRCSQVASLLGDNPFKEQANTEDSSTRMPPEEMAKKMATASASGSGSKSPKPTIENAFKQASPRKVASKKLSAAKGASKKVSARRYASKKAVGKKS